MGKKWYKILLTLRASDLHFVVFSKQTRQNGRQKAMSRNAFQQTKVATQISSTKANNREDRRRSANKYSRTVVTVFGIVENASVILSIMRQKRMCWRTTICISRCSSTHSFFVSMVYYFLFYTLPFVIPQYWSLAFDVDESFFQRTNQFFFIFSW